MANVLIIDDPHGGQVITVPEVINRLLLADPSTSPLRSWTTQCYVRESSHPDDFVNGIEARYRWDP